MTSDNRYLHLIRQDCPLPPGTHVVVYCKYYAGIGVCVCDISDLTSNNLPLAGRGMASTC